MSYDTRRTNATKMNTKTLTISDLVALPYTSPGIKVTALMTRRRILGDSLHGNTPSVTEDEDNPGFSDF